jgi:ferredoxin-NADP reductase
MSTRTIRCRFALWIFLASSLCTAANAQEGGEHSAHHGGAAGAAPMAGEDAMGSPGAAGSSGMGSMMGGMMDGEGEHGGGSRRPFFSQLLTVPTLDAEARRKLAAQADTRIEAGLATITEATAAGTHAATAAARLDAARRLREGVDQFSSGAAAQAALNGAQPPEETAISWFREQLHMEPVGYDEPLRWFGVSSSHLLVMLFLGLVSATLIGLQLSRLARIKKIVSTGPTGRGSVKAQEPLAVPAASKVAAPVENRLEALAPSNAPPTAGASLRKPKSWTGQLRIVQVVRETPTVQTFRLADPAADRLPFDFLPGQFLQVEVEPEAGKPARRSYTIASSPTQRAYVELTVKREEQGVVSRHLHDRVSAGDLVKVTGPFGAFTFTGTDADSIVLIAGGVGITPMMSVLRYLTDTAWAGDIFFLYGARSTEEFVFRDEIERMEQRFSNLHVIAAMERSPGTVWMGPTGPITREMLTAAVPDITRRRIHLCGPPGMMAAMRKELAELGVPEAQLYTEAFGPASLPQDSAELEVKPAPARQPASPSVAATTITFSVSGVSAALPVDQTVLEAAEGAGVEIPYACRAGECGVCVIKLLAGDVTMDVESGLAASDKADGYILACQAKSTGQPLVVEA